MNTMMIALQDQTVKNLINNIKIFKSDEIIMIINDSLYGSNKLFSYLKSTNDILPEFMSLQVQSFCYEIKPLVDNVCSKNLFKIDIDIYGNLYVWLNGETKPVIIMNSIIPPIGWMTINNMNYLYSLEANVNYDDISDDVDIIKLQSSLSKDGLIMYRKDRYLMTIYKGLLPLNKSDKLSLKIYDEISENGNVDFFTSIFTIIKKKSKSIKVFLKYRYL